VILPPHAPQPRRRRVVERAGSGRGEERCESLQNIITARTGAVCLRQSATWMKTAIRRRGVDGDEGIRTARPNGRAIQLPELPKQH
jgi:hypothetical protein